MNAKRDITVLMAALALFMGMTCDTMPTNMNMTDPNGNMTDPLGLGDADTDNDNNNGGNVDPDPDDGTPQSNTWSQLSQPCGGTKTDAFWFDDRNHGYIGCGENASGFGLWVTDDGGETWTADPAFNGARINDIRRASDGKLYATGTDTVSGAEAFIIDESGAQRQLVPIYAGGNNAFLSVSQGENIAVTDDGQIFVDSLTGVQTAHHAAGALVFTELNTFLGDGSNAEQMSRVVGLNNRFWAVGSLINQPATVYYPSALGTQTFEMDKIEVQPNTQDGELHDIYLWSETSALVVGFDQSLRFPLIYRLDGDPSDINNWTKINLADSGIEYQGGAWKMSVIGDVVVLVGQTFPTNNGFVVFSADRGQTWTDISPITPEGDFAANLMTNVWLFPDGTVLAAAESSELWRLNP